MSPSLVSIVPRGSIAGSLNFINNVTRIVDLRSLWSSTANVCLFLTALTGTFCANRFQPIHYSIIHKWKLYFCYASSPFAPQNRFYRGNSWCLLLWNGKILKDMSSVVVVFMYPHFQCAIFSCGDFSCTAAVILLLSQYHLLFIWWG